MAAEIQSPQGWMATNVTGRVALESVVVHLAVNTVPTAEVVYHRSDGGILTPMSADALARMKQFQNLRDSGQTVPDSAVIITDGKLNFLTLTGFVTAPVISFGRSMSSERANIVGVDAVLAGLDMGIYRDCGTSERAESSVSDLQAIPGQTDGDVGKMLERITDTLVGNYDVSLAEAQTKSEQTLMAAQHAVNVGGALPAWKGILSNTNQNSPVVYESWPGLIAQFPELGNHLANVAASRMKQQNGTFLDTMFALCADFQMYYVPSTDGHGRLARADQKVLQPASLDLSVIQADIVDGSSRILQLGGVVVMAGSMKENRDEGNTADMTYGIVGQFPNPLRAGNVQKVGPPPWLLLPDGNVPFAPEAAQKIPMQVCDLSSFAQRYEAYRKRLDAASASAAETVLTEYAKVLFLSMLLENATSTFRVPLNLELEVGRRYKVKIAGGGEFEAFLNGVTHSLQLISGTQLSTFTEVQFSHILL